MVDMQLKDLLGRKVKTVSNMEKEGYQE